MAQSYYVRYKISSSEWRIRKFDQDMEPREEYVLIKDGQKELVCSCPAYTSWCRHRKMMSMFDSADGGKSEAYNFINKTHTPLLAYDPRKNYPVWVKGFPHV